MHFGVIIRKFEIDLLCICILSNLDQRAELQYKENMYVNNKAFLKRIKLHLVLW